MTTRNKVVFGDTVLIDLTADTVPHAYDSWDDAADAMVAWDE